MLGFPCNQFGDQEPGTDAEIAEFAASTYDVTFPMFSKIEVNGEGAAPLYDWLTEKAPDDEGNRDIAWNFTKFLIGRDGEVIERFGPMVSPEDIAEKLPAVL